MGWDSLPDAQQYTVISGGLFTFMILALWKGIPYGRKTVSQLYEDEDGYQYEENKKVWKYIPVLWPFKILTVLFHEICHAVIGSILPPFPRVTYIRVNAVEAGATGFSKTPNMYLTAPAGYVGSCAVGCALIWSGFDALTSKYAALGLAGGLVFCVLVCILVRPKLAFRYHKEWLKMVWAQFRGQVKKARSHKRAYDEKVGPTTAMKREDSHHHGDHGNSKDHQRKADEAMVSLDIIFLVTLILSGILFAAWYIADSIALRFVVLFLGVMSAVYALADVIDDGIKHRRHNGSDARVFATYCRPNGKDVSKWTRYYAIGWLVVQSVCIGVVLYFAFHRFKQTMAQQAYTSRQFLPTSNHWQAADTWAKAHAAGGKVGEKVSNWVDGLSSSGDDQNSGVD